MKNLVQQGRELNYIVPTGVSLTVGQAILLGQCLFVVFSTNNNTATATGPNATTGFAGDTVTLVSYGVFSLPKAAGTGTGFAIGGLVYWDTSANAVTGVDGQSAVAATSTNFLAVTTAAATGDILATLVVGGVDLLAAPLDFTAGSYTATQTAAAIVLAINNNTVVTGFTATNSVGVITVTGPASAGATLNGEAAVIPATTGTGTMVLAAGSSPTLAGGADATTNYPIGWGWDIVAAANGDTTAIVKLKVG